MDVVSTDPPPPASPKPPRSALATRDILGALGLLVLVVLVVGGLSRSCTFSPGGPTVDSSRLPVVDAPGELRRLAPGVPFPVRIPAVPPEWRANAVDVVDLEGGARALSTGYLTPEGRYLRLLQTDAGEEVLLAADAGARPAPAYGVVEIDGARWVTYPGERSEPIWIAQVAAPDGRAVRMLITGSGGEADIRTLARAAAAGEIVTR
jgi:hypothetical protein